MQIRYYFSITMMNHGAESTCFELTP